MGVCFDPAVEQHHSSTPSPPERGVRHQTLTDVDPEATVLSVDVVGAFDLISRASMLEGLRGTEARDSVPPFRVPVLQFRSHVYLGGFGRMTWE